MCVVVLTLHVCLFDLYLFDLSYHGSHFSLLFIYFLGSRQECCYKMMCVGIPPHALPDLENDVVRLVEDYPEDDTVDVDGESVDSDDEMDEDDIDVGDDLSMDEED